MLIVLLAGIPQTLVLFMCPITMHNMHTYALVFIFGKYADPKYLDDDVSGWYCTEMITVSSGILYLTFFVFFSSISWLVYVYAMHLWRQKKTGRLSHDTPRTAYLTSMLKVSLGFVCIYFLSFGVPFLVYHKALFSENFILGWLLKGWNEKGFK